MEDKNIAELERILKALSPADVQACNEIFNYFKLLIGLEEDFSIEICQENIKKMLLGSYKFGDIVLITLSYLSLFKHLSQELRMTLMELIQNLYEDSLFSSNSFQMNQIFEIVIHMKSFLKLNRNLELMFICDDLLKKLQVYQNIINFLKYNQNKIITHNSIISRIHEQLQTFNIEKPEILLGVMQRLKKNIPLFMANVLQIDSREINNIIKVICDHFKISENSLKPIFEQNNIRFSTISPILEEIDQKIIQPFCFGSIVIDDWHLKMMKKAEQISKKYEKLLKEKVKKYKNTPYGDIPEIENILSEFILQLLDIEVQKDIFQTLKEIKHLKQSISIKSSIESLLELPLELQYIYSEILLIFTDNPSNTLIFLINSNFANQHYETISTDWAEEYIQRVCTYPFCEALSKFNENRAIIPEDISQVTKNIRFILLPQGLSGINLHNGSIVINFFMCKIRKEVSFAVYLHELSHFLLRRDCQTIADHMKNKSFETQGINSTEGGKFLEEFLFGQSLKEISFPAADFLFNSQVPHDIEIFREEFSKLNEDRTSGSVRIKGTSMVFLGTCGFRKLSIDRKMRKIFN